MPSTFLHQYLRRHANRLPILFNSLYAERRIYEQFYPLMQEQIRKWFANQLNPFNLCPRSIMIWLLIPPYNAIGISIAGLHEIDIYWRQQMEPNETVYTLFKLLVLKIPFPLTLLIAFAAFGLVITDGANRLVRAARMEYEEELQRIEAKIDVLSNAIPDIQTKIGQAMAEANHQMLVRALNPFNLTPRMSVYFPIYDTHTTLGILLMDFRHIEISLKQSLEPNETILSLIRFLDLYAPFPLPIMVMLLSIGLFFTGKIFEFDQAAREEVLTEIKRALRR